MKWLKYLIYGVLHTLLKLTLGVIALVLMVIGVLILLTSTEPGTRWLFATAERYAPGELRLDTVNGTIFQGLDLVNLHLRQELPTGPLTVSVAQAHLQLATRPLLQRRVELPQLKINGLRVQLPPASTEPDAPEDPDGTFLLPEQLALPVTLQITEFSLQDAVIALNADTQIVIDQFSFGLTAATEAIELHYLALAMPEVALHTRGQLVPAERWPLNFAGQWLAPLPESVAQGLEIDRRQPLNPEESHTAAGELAAGDPAAGDPAAGNPAARNPSARNLAAGNAEFPQPVQIAGSWQLTGDLRDRLQLQHHLTDLWRLATQVELHDPLGALAWKVTSDWDVIRYQINPDMRLTLNPGQLASSGSLAAWEIEVQTSALLNDVDELHLGIRALGSATRITLAPLTVQAPEGRITVSGPLRWDPDVDWDLALIISDIPADLLATLGVPWPNTDLQQLSLRSRGQLDLAQLRTIDPGTIDPGTIDSGTRDVVTKDSSTKDSSTKEPGTKDPGTKDPSTKDPSTKDPGTNEGLGGLQAVTMELVLENLRGQLAGQSLSGAGRINLADGQLQISPFDLNLGAQGLLRIAGAAAIADTTPFGLTVHSSGLDLDFLIPEQGLKVRQLDLTATGQYQMVEQALTLNLNLDPLQAEFAGNPIRARGRFQGQDTDWEIIRAELSAGRNQLQASGTITPILDLSVALDAPDLAPLLPDLAGTVTLRSQLTGTLEHPLIDLQAQARSLRYQEQGLERLDLQARLGLTPDAPADIRLQLSDLILGPEQIVPEVTLTMTGIVPEHQLNLAADGGEFGRLGLQAAGGFDLDTQEWRGRLNVLDLAQPLAGEWALRQPVALRASPTGAQIEPLCLGREATGLCLQGVWNPGAESQGQVQLNAFDLSWLASLLPDESNVIGLLDAEARVNLDPTGKWQARLRVEPGPGLVQADLGAGLALEIPYRDGMVELQTDGEALEVSLALKFFSDGYLDLALERLPDTADPRLAGHLRAGLSSLNLLDTLSPELRNSHGRIEADLQLAGRQSSPELQGFLRLTEAGVDLPIAGLELRVPELRVEADGSQTLAIQGQVLSAAEALNVRGELRWNEQQPEADLQILGENFLALNRPDMRARVDTDIKIHFDTVAGLVVRGDVTIPHARIHPPDLPSGAINVSADEIIVGMEPTTETGSPVDLRLRVRLGEDVLFDGFGLDARLTGDVDLVAPPGRPVQIFGEVNIPEGKYQSFGQDLRLEQGLITFQGPPESPELNLRAVRTIRSPEVVVGLEIGGTPDALRSRVFSEPPMDDTEAMAFLLTGRALGAGRNGDANIGGLIAGAAAAWGVEQTNLFAERGSGRLGLDEFGLDTEDGLDHGRLRVGTYLTPNLLLRYSRGLFDDSFQVLLRYQITQSLSVETSSGNEGQGIDFIWRRER